MNRQMPSDAKESPLVTNRRQKFEKRLTNTARETIRVRSSKGRIARKRKKHVHQVERENYRNLLVAVMNDLYLRRTR